eukprot:15462570-Alexandrium_andersonii.AAC.1
MVVCTGRGLEQFATAGTPGQAALGGAAASNDAAAAPLPGKTLTLVCDQRSVVTCAAAFMDQKLLLKVE